MRAGYNPTRRNRNIGTAKQGHGQNNRLVIPMPGGLHSSLDRIGEHVRERRQVAGADVTFIIEALRDGCLYPCSIDDVASLLERVPASDWAGIKTIVFRQPSRKQEILCPAWGRLRYGGTIASGKNRIVARGPMILLDAIEEGLCIKWPARLALEDQAELERLHADGHEVERAGNHHVVRITAESARWTQLYRTMLHEIGHWFDWLEKVEGPAGRGEDFDILVDRYFARPQAEREAFANRYAARASVRLKAVGAIPFEPLGNTPIA